MGSPARTILIINVSAALKNSNETLSSLRFGCQSQSKLGYGHGYEEGMSIVAQHRGNVSDRGNISAMGNTNTSMSMMSGHSNMWGKVMEGGEEIRRVRVDGGKGIGHQHSQHHHHSHNYSQSQGHNHSRNHSQNTQDQQHHAHASTTEEDNTTSLNEQVHHRFHTTTSSHNTKHISEHIAHHNTHHDTQHHIHRTDSLVDPQPYPSDPLLQDPDMSVPSISVLGLDKDAMDVEGRNGGGSYYDPHVMAPCTNAGDGDGKGGLSHDPLLPSSSSSPSQHGGASHPSHGKKKNTSPMASPSALRRKGPFVISGTSVDASQISGGDQHTHPINTHTHTYQHTQLINTYTLSTHTLSTHTHTPLSSHTPYQHTHPVSTHTLSTHTAYQHTPYQHTPYQYPPYTNPIN